MQAYVVCLVALLARCHAQYQPNWDSLDSRPLPSWYDQAKVGIFIHWGVFSVPSFGSEWFWNHWKDNDTKYVDFMTKNYRPGFTYADFAPQFTAELWDPEHWADVFAKSGAKYVVLTSKHHEGYTLWPSKTSFSWNSMDVGPRRDLVGELAVAIRKHPELHFGLYHSLFEWYNPLYLNDAKENRTEFVDYKTLPELYEIVNAYHPDVIWSDGDWGRSPDYWRSTDFLAWLYNESPVKDTVVTNDRWGIGTMCKHGGFLTCSDHYNPGVLQTRKWENAFTIDKNSWGLRREAVLADYHTINDIISELVRTVSCGGNVLINIGPAHDGTIRAVFEERLTQLGDWLAVNGEAIYDSSPWSVQNDSIASGVWYTQRGGSVYAITLSWPEDGELKLGSAPEATDCQLLGFGSVKCDNGAVKFPGLAGVSSRWAWVVKFGSGAGGVATHKRVASGHGAWTRL